MHDLNLMPTLVVYCPSVRRLDFFRDLSRGKINLKYWELFFSIYLLLAISKRPIDYKLLYLPKCDCFFILVINRGSYSCIGALNRLILVLFLKQILVVSNVL